MNLTTAVNSPVVVTFGSKASLTNSVLIPRGDQRVRLLGGTWEPVAPKPMFPFHLFDIGRSTHYTFDGKLGNYTATTTAVEFTMRGNAFEWQTLGSGNSGGWSLFVDGVRTNVDGYTLGSNGNGQPGWSKVVLPNSGQARRIRMVLPYRPLGELRLDAGATLLTTPVPRPSSMVVVGDSITAAAGASQPWRGWATLLGEMLGIDDIRVSGVGSSGYLNRGRGPYLTFRERITDVLNAVNGGPPDMVVIAGGINDSQLPPAQVGAEAEAYYRALRAGAPDMIIVVLGPFAGYPGYTGNMLPQLRDELFRAASRVDRVQTVDVTNWVTPDSRDNIFRDGGADGPHPKDTGHALYAQLAQDAIRRIVDRL